MAKAQRLNKEGNTAHNRRQYAEAVECYTEALKAYPTAPEVRANRATSYLHWNKAEEALADALESAQLNASDMRAHYLQGLAHLRLGNGAEAVAALELVRDIAPQPPTSLEKSLAEANELAAKQADIYLSIYLDIYIIYKHIHTHTHTHTHIYI